MNYVPRYSRESIERVTKMQRRKMMLSLGFMAFVSVGCSSPPDPFKITTIKIGGRNFSQLDSSERLGSKFAHYTIGATVADSPEQAWLAVIGGEPAHAMDKVVEFTTTNRTIDFFDRTDVDGCVVMTDPRGGVHFTMHVVTESCGYSRSCALAFGERSPGSITLAEAKESCTKKDKVFSVLRKALKSL